MRTSRDRKQCIHVLPVDAPHTYLTVEMVLGSGASIDPSLMLSHDKLGETTALHVAALEGTVGAAELLVATGCDINSTACAHGQTPLHVAAEAGRAELVAFFIATGGAEIDADDQKGTSPLLYACQHNESGCAHLLLRAGANPESVEECGRTPLMFATSQRDIILVQDLLRACPPIRRRNYVGVADNSGVTALMRAARTNAVDIVECLAEYCDVNAQDVVSLSMCCVCRWTHLHSLVM